MPRRNLRGRPRLVALSVAGLDSGGGAGVETDLKVYALHGLHGTAVVTAITAQDSRRVHAVHVVPAAMVSAQLTAVLGDFDVRVIKTGMLATATAVNALLLALARRPAIPLVVDPVLIASSGARLLSLAGVARLRDRLVPRATLVTPNLAEAAALTGEGVRTPSDMARAARALVAMGAGAALVKGGHLQGQPVDILWDGTHLSEFRHPRLSSQHTHGTGSVLAAAIASHLALGHPLAEAVASGICFVTAAIASAQAVGRGRGAVDPIAAAERLRSGDPLRRPGSRRRQAL